MLCPENLESDGRVRLYMVDGGQMVLRWPPDARELLDSGAASLSPVVVPAFTATGDPSASEEPPASPDAAVDGT